MKVYYLKLKWAGVYTVWWSQTHTFKLKDGMQQIHLESISKGCCEIEQLKQLPNLVFMIEC